MYVLETEVADWRKERASLSHQLEAKSSMIEVLKKEIDELRQKNTAILSKKVAMSLSLEDELFTRAKMGRDSGVVTPGASDAAFAGNPGRTRI